MSRITWDTIGGRRFETGVDRGVFYTTAGIPIPWNGLKTVTESPSGGEATPYYTDGIKHVNVPGREDFGGTIEAYTYPDEFAEYDGSYTLPTGLIAQQQRRKQFALSYRTRIGNDLAGQYYGYKLHIIYNVLAAPAEKAYSSVGDSPDPTNFSWAFTTTPVKPSTATPLAPLAHVIIDSTKTNPTFLRFIEDHLYGSDTFPAQLMSLNDLLTWFEQPHRFLKIENIGNVQTGVNPLSIQADTADLIGDSDKGLYTVFSDTRLKKTATDGLYSLGT